MSDSLTYKISCPSCGASSGFSETTPGSYTCGYCDTAFEHQSIIPSKNQEKVLYDYFIKLDQDYKKVSQENPDRDTIVYGLLMQMNGIIEGLESSNSLHKVLQVYFDHTDKEIDRLESIGLKGLDTLDVVLEKELMIEARFLADYKLFVSQTLYRYKKEEELLKKALQYIVSAELIYQRVFTTFDHTTTGLKLDILRDLGLEEAFALGLKKALQSEDRMFVKRITYRFKEFIN
ncbi:hypothetical protein GCM10011344_13010 [Dokdonia pacifica]|uniref:Uncharacterized protein n=1 Tax=Dokdonia pacifica TaxID=1627892 RepID=A0A238W9Z6_9FLAO|nr:hypothetical protein [Dokdonia pacifica]GGG13725.1 hypothetical protein GCM10011344_13010 [Dokdonia pacifica]SNR43328.1 hypothetical protein SAMN06265376_101850 [Dokdonia pacifica]